MRSRKNRLEDDFDSKVVRRDIRAFCEDCSGPDRLKDACPELQNHKPCPFYEHRRLSNGELLQAIKANCRFCLNGHKKDFACTSPECSLYHYFRQIGGD
jgi:hypothetical protein